MALAMVPSLDSVGSRVSPLTPSAGLRSAVVGMSFSMAALDVDSMPGDECASLAQVLARHEKSVAFTRARLAARAVGCDEHVRAGQPNAGEWLARLTGVSREEARAELATASAAALMPALASALARGRLSMRQGHEIAETEAEVPGSTSSLIGQAEGSGFKWLKDECRRIREAATDPDDLAARQKTLRRTRWWKDALGMIRFSGALSPLDGVPIAKRLQVEADRLFRAARRAGDDETTSEQFAADALVNLLFSGSGAAPGSRSKPSTELVVVADIRSLLTGTVQPGGTCHVMGGGPIPVSEAIALAEDAFIKCVTHDGVRITSMVHYGRRKKLPAVLASALRLGAPPLFHGLSCGDRCGCELGIEIDHIDPLANGGPTSVDNLEGKCSPSHKAKTSRERAAGLFGKRVSRRRSKPDAERAPPDG